MELTYSPKLYEEKYHQDMTLEIYQDCLRRGLQLLEENGLEKQHELKDLKLIRMALEFNRQVIRENKGKASLISSYIAHFTKQ
jgi:hypothetical protein